MATYYFWDEIEDNVIEEYDGDTGNTIVEYTTEPTLYGSGRLHHKLCSEQHLFQIAFIPTCGQAFVFDSDL